MSKKRRESTCARARARLGARADEPDAHGATALDYACGAGHADAARACLEVGADALGDALGLCELFITKRHRDTLVALTPAAVPKNPYLEAGNGKLKALPAKNDFRGQTEAEVGRRVVSSAGVADFGRTDAA